ncbi:MAG: hypothetical protein ACP5LA_06410 [Thermoplasmata archaeon]|nr:hypothetical protein [Thermoplasmata archaeon]
MNFSIIVMDFAILIMGILTFLMPDLLPKTLQFDVRIPPEYANDLLIKKLNYALEFIYQF